MRIDKELSDYRFDAAAECLNEAQTLFNASQYYGAANRLYYCIFNCMRSILALENVDFKKHSAVIGHFRKYYIHTGKFEFGEKLSDIITTLFNLRGESDYGAFFTIEKQDIIKQIENAEFFLGQVKAFLEK